MADGEASLSARDEDLVGGRGGGLVVGGGDAWPLCFVWVAFAEDGSASTLRLGGKSFGVPIFAPRIPLRLTCLSPVFCAGPHFNAAFSILAPRPL